MWNLGDAIVLPTDKKRRIYKRECILFKALFTWLIENLRLTALFFLFRSAAYNQKTLSGMKSRKKLRQS